MPIEPIELETRVAGLEQTIRDLRKVVEGLDDVGEEATAAGKKGEASGGSWRKLQQDFFYLKENISAVATGVQQAVAVIKGMAEEYERTSRVLSSFSGDVTEASRRTAGLISNLDLMIARNKAAQAGVQLSAHDLANLAVKATELARATGEEATAAFERLTQAVAKGEAEALREYGIRLDGITNKSQASAGALSQLEAQVGTTDASAGGLGSTFTRVETAMSNATTEFVRGFDSVESLKGAFDDVGEAIGRVAQAFGADLSTGLETFVTAGAAAAEITATLASAFASFADAVANLANGDFEGAFNKALEAQRSMTDLTAGILLGEGAMISRLQARLGGGAGGKSGKTDDSTRIAGLGGEGSGDGGGKWNEPKKLRALLGGAAANDNDAQTALLLEQQRTLLAGRGGTSAAVSDLDLLGLKEGNANTVGSAFADDKGAEAAEDMLRFIRDQNKELERQGKLVTDIASTVGGALMSAFEHAAASQQGFLSGLAQGFDIWAGNFAKEEVGKGLSAAASALGATFWNPPLAGGLAAEAAGHFAAAAAFGGASIAIPNTSGGASPAAAAGANRPVAEGASTGNGGPTTVVINMNVPNAVLTQEEAGRIMYSNMQAAKRANMIPKAA